VAQPDRWGHPQPPRRFAQHCLDPLYFGAGLSDAIRDVRRDIARTEKAMLAILLLLSRSQTDNSRPTQFIDSLHIVAYSNAVRFVDQRSCV
jgi:hypothetical protein